MIADPIDLRDRIIAFDVRRGPYDRTRHPLYPWKVWLERCEGMSPQRADTFACRLRTILMTHTLEEVLTTRVPDAVIDPTIIQGRQQHSRAIDLCFLRRTVTLIQKFHEQGPAA